MSQVRNTSPSDLLRPLTSRSVIASTLLGMNPPRLSAAALVASGEHFGVAPGTTRVALSRMVDAGELTSSDDGVYALAGPLLARQARQEQGRHPRERAWKGNWRIAVVTGGARSAAERATRRRTMAVARMAELREGVWVRPDNLDAPSDPSCAWFVGKPEAPVNIESLFGLREWASTARALHRELERTAPRLLAHDASAMGETFVIAAATTRHLTVDPLLPAALLPTAWPAQELRNAYDAYQESFYATWREWYRSTLD